MHQTEETFKWNFTPKPINMPVELICTPKVQQGVSRQDLRLWERQNWQLLIEMDVFRGHVFVHAGK